MAFDLEVESCIEHSFDSNIQLMDFNLNTLISELLFSDLLKSDNVAIVSLMITIAVL